MVSLVTVDCTVADYRRTPTVTIDSTSVRSRIVAESTVVDRKGIIVVSADSTAVIPRVAVDGAIADFYVAKQTRNTAAAISLNQIIANGTVVNGIDAVHDGDSATVGATSECRVAADAAV